MYKAWSRNCQVWQIWFWIIACPWGHSNQKSCHCISSVSPSLSLMSYIPVDQLSEKLTAMHCDSVANRRSGSLWFVLPGGSGGRWWWQHASIWQWRLASEWSGLVWLLFWRGRGGGGRWCIPIKQWRPSTTYRRQAPIWWSHLLCKISCCDLSCHKAWQQCAQSLTVWFLGRAERLIEMQAHTPQCAMHSSRMLTLFNFVLQRGESTKLSKTGFFLEWKGSRRTWMHITTRTQLLQTRKKVRAPQEISCPDQMIYNACARLTCREDKKIKLGSLVDKRTSNLKVLLCRSDLPRICYIPRLQNRRPVPATVCHHSEGQPTAPAS